MPDPDQVLDRFRLDGRVAIITGASRGIGRALAEAFAAVGATVVIASRKPEACEEVATAIRASGGSTLAIPTHVGSLEALSHLAELTASTFGRIDIIVNNAANALALPIGSITEAAWQKTQDTNERAALFLVQAALPQLKQSPCAAVLNIVTVGVFTSGRNLAMYTAAKAGLLMLTRSMAAELASDGIRVNALAPGAVDTDMMRNNDPATQALLAGSSAMGRMATPEEMVGPALFLVSSASSFVTGSVLVADGGLVFH